jgi:AcrR family transcriptional regulator
MTTERQALSRPRIVDAAAQVADERGLAGVTMRNIGRQLGVEAMSLYHHVAAKETVLDELADWIFARIELPGLDDPWRGAMADRAASARRTLAAHPWGLGLIESRRTPGPALLRHHDRVLGCLRSNGFTVAQAAHAFSVLDAYVHGFVLTEVNLPFGERESTEEFVDEIQSTLPAAEYPYLVEMIAELVTGRDYRYADEFTAGLDLVLDGIERLVAGQADADRAGQSR